MAKLSQISALLLLCSKSVLADFAPFEFDLIYPRNSTYAAGYPLTTILGWNSTKFDQLGRNFSYETTILDRAQNPPTEVTHSSLGLNLLGQLSDASWEFSRKIVPLPVGQYTFQYTVSVPRNCNSTTDQDAFNATNSIDFTISSQPGALHPNGSDIFVKDFACPGISIPINEDRDSGACSQIDTPNAGPVLRSPCAIDLTQDRLEKYFKSANVNPDVPYASQTATGTIKSSTSSGLGMMATPAPVLLAAGVGLLGAAVL